MICKRCGQDIPEDSNRCINLSCRKDQRTEAKLQALVDESFDRECDLQERLDASLDKYEVLEQQVAELKKHVNLLTELVDAVKSSDFDGIRCEDLPSGNWFDAKARATATKEK